MAQTSNGFIMPEKDLELRGTRRVARDEAVRIAGVSDRETSCADQPLLEKAREEADFYLAKPKSVVTAKMTARIKQDPRFGLAASDK
jgi:RecG-like helicase